MKILNLTVETVGSEMIVNGKHWMDSAADTNMVEELIKKLPLEQQWTLLTILRKTVCKVEDNYRQSRVMAHELPMTDYERMKRNSSAGRGNVSAGLAALQAGKRNVPLRDVFGI